MQSVQRGNVHHKNQINKVRKKHTQKIKLFNRCFIVSRLDIASSNHTHFSNHRKRVPFSRESSTVSHRVSFPSSSSRRSHRSLCSDDKKKHSQNLLFIDSQSEINLRWEEFHSHRIARDDWWIFWLIFSVVSHSKRSLKRGILFLFSTTSQKLTVFRPRLNGRHSDAVVTFFVSFFFALCQNAKCSMSLSHFVEVLSSTFLFSDRFTR